MGSFSKQLEGVLVQRTQCSDYSKSQHSSKASGTDLQGALESAGEEMSQAESSLWLTVLESLAAAKTDIQHHDMQAACHLCSKVSVCHLMASIC